MKNSSGTGGDQGGSSSNPPNPATPNPSPPPTEESPRRRSGGENTPHAGSPGGRGSPSSAPRASRELAMTTPPPVMGVPGQSAFTPYSRPPPSQPQWPAAPGSSRGPSGDGGLGFSGGQVAQAVPVGGSGGSSSGVAAPVALRIGGSPAARKRFREGGAAAPAPGGNQPGEGVDHRAVNCSVCGKVFLSPKALFGHMRSHPDRGWKGAHPPPAFRAEEEFADLRAEVAAAAGGREEGMEDAEGAAKEEEDEQNYRLPDLNNPPPPEN